MNRFAGKQISFADKPTSDLSCTRHIDTLVISCHSFCHTTIIEGSLEVKLPTIWTDAKQSREEAERRERLEERRVEEKE